MARCKGCGCAVPRSMATCPVCGTPVRRGTSILSRIFWIALAAVVLFPMLAAGTMFRGGGMLRVLFVIAVVVLALRVFGRR